MWSADRRAFPHARAGGSAPGQRKSQIFSNSLMLVPPYCDRAGKAECGPPISERGCSMGVRVPCKPGETFSRIIFMVNPRGKVLPEAIGRKILFRSAWSGGLPLENLRFTGNAKHFPSLGIFDSLCSHAHFVRTQPFRIGMRRDVPPFTIHVCPFEVQS